MTRTLHLTGLSAADEESVMDRAVTAGHKF